MNLNESMKWTWGISLNSLQTPMAGQLSRPLAREGPGTHYSTTPDSASSTSEKEWPSAASVWPSAWESASTLFLQNAEGLVETKFG